MRHTGRERSSSVTSPRCTRLLLVAPSAVSGIVEPLFSRLGNYFDTVRIRDTHETVMKYLFILSTFSPSLPCWKARAFGQLAKYLRTTDSFMRRTKAMSSRVKKLADSIDAILQVSSMFRTWVDTPLIPYFMYMDFTSKLSEEYAPQWAFPKELREDRYRLEGETYRHAEKVFTANDASASSIMMFYEADPEKVVKVRLGVNLDRMPDPRTSFDNSDLLFVTTEFDRQQGQRAVDAFHILKKRHPDLKLTIVGKEMRKDGVYGTARIPHNELQGLYDQHSIFIMPAIVGGVQSTLEAMAHGCTCIVERNNLHLSGSIKHGENGLLANSTDPEALARTIDEAIHSEDLRRRLGIQAQITISESYTWDRVASKIAAEIKGTLLS